MGDSVCIPRMVVLNERNSEDGEKSILHAGVDHRSIVDAHQLLLDCADGGGSPWSGGNRYLMIIFVIFREYKFLTNYHNTN